ncbi:glycosyl transferase [Arthrobacter sp. NicSoilB11]|nr:glycosyl transferase [Arthrobacter sp. NicSoilB11]
MDWKSFFFGSLDWGNSITVDKPPLSLWIMGISVRLFGLSPESIMAPQAAMGVATTLMVYRLLRSNYSAMGALTAAVVFFTTPIITLLSRYNNPDPLMLLFMVGAAYLVVRAVEKTNAQLVYWAGLALGLAFMTKQLQALLCFPAIAVAIGISYKSSLWQRLKVGLLGFGVMIISGLAWMLIVELIPASARPFIGGSPSNSILQLTLGYNGIDRIISKEEDPTIQLLPADFRSQESDAGIFRLFNANFSQEASWLLIVALLACFVIAFKWRSITASRGRLATSIIAVGWFLTAYFLLSFMGNGIHTYYSATMVPPLALVIGLALDLLMENRDRISARLAASAICLVGTGFAFAIISLGTGWLESFGPSILMAGCVGSALLAVKPPFPAIDRIAISLLIVALLGPPVAASWHNAVTPHNGSNPLSGTLTKSDKSLSQFLAKASLGDPPWAKELGYGLDPGPDLTTRLQKSESCLWAAATYPGQTAAKYQLAAGKPVMSLSGFMGVDPNPTLEQFQSKVAAGQICYLVWQQSHLEVPERATTLTQISQWVKENFTSEIVDGSIVYDLQERLH